MPDSALDRLCDLGVSSEAIDKLTLYHDLLVKWQMKINLVGPDTIKDAWSRHFLDSLQLLKYIPNLHARMIDLGSGAGFPGMALAIAGAEDMHIIESDGKKIAFLKEVARITKTSIAIHHARIEDHPVPHGSVILSRACCVLDTLLSYSSSYVSHETICLFHKGKNYSKEIDDACDHWDFDLNVFASAADMQGVILKLSNLRKRGACQPIKPRNQES